MGLSFKGTGNLIFINGVIQDPGVAYQFDGGSSFTLTEPPLPSDKVSIFFYRGSREIDSKLVTAYQTIKVGDNVQVFSNNSNLAITTTQNSRVVFDISSSDKIQTNIYSDVGIDVNNSKPLSWTKQKIDTQINGQIVYNTLGSIKSIFKLDLLNSFSIYLTDDKGNLINFNGVSSFFTFQFDIHRRYIERPLQFNKIMDLVNSHGPRPF
jgi:hypothetical protein